MKVVAVLQARMGSTRFPGKVAAPVLGAPMLQRQIERATRAARLDAIVVATSQAAEDDRVAQIAERSGVPCVRGSLHDVLERFIAVASAFPSAHYVRLTGDCPLTDAAVLDLVVEHHLDGGFDYTSNTSAAGYPDGLDVEAFTRHALECTHREATSAADREHVTPYMRRPRRFRTGYTHAPRPLRHLRLTVDWPSDLAVVESIFAELYPADPAFGLDDVLALLDRRPDLLNLVAGCAPHAVQVRG